jgi:adenosine kinase
MSFYAKKPRAGKGDLAIITAGNSNEMLDLADFYYRKKTPFIFDPGQQIINFTKNQLRQLIKQAKIYIVNDYELSLSRKITGYNKATILKSAGVLITTLGNQGSTIEIQFNNKLERAEIKAVKTNSVKDPTGAGDAYRAGLIKGLINSHLMINSENIFKFSWLKIGQIASLAAVYAVEQYGTQNHCYSYDQFKKRYQSTFGQNCD